MSASSRSLSSNRTERIHIDTLWEHRLWLGISLDELAGKYAKALDCYS
jgi:hypothetical protein